MNTMRRRHETTALNHSAPGRHVGRSYRGAGRGLMRELLADAQPTGAGCRRPVPLRREMERAFREDFSGVEVRVGVPGLKQAGAQGIACGELLAFADIEPRADVVAHELAHVVQSRSGPRASSPLSRPVALAEREADRAAAQVVAGETVSPLNAQPAGWIQPSLISHLVKMGARKVSKGTLKNFVETQIRRRLRGLVDRNAARRFAREADELMDMLEDPWWLTALSWVPILGDGIDLARVPVQIKRTFEKADRLERRVDRLLRMQRTRASDLLSGTLKSSPSYDSSLAELTYGEIVRMAPRSPAAAKMKKLIEQQARLMGKL